MSNLQPQLPGALVERERKCDICDCWTTAPYQVEMRGAMYTLCMDCEHDNAEAIADAAARRDADQAAEDAAQEDM